MPIKRVVQEGMFTPVKIWTNEVEYAAEDQLRKLSQLPFIHKHIAVMPDVHMGNGTSVGTVIPTIKAIIPSAVGVDLGCGMMAVKLSLKAHQLPDNLSAVRSSIEAMVPHGRSDNGGLNDKGAWSSEVPEDVTKNWLMLASDQRWQHLCATHPKINVHANTYRHLGSLGTGNHFIELCLDLEDNVWIMLHSGSRGIGNRIGSYFIERAKEKMQQWHVSLPHPELAFLPEGEELFDDYVNAVSWAQDFARVNREIMMDNVLAAMSLTQQFPVFTVLDTAINCHHNYVEMENHFGKNVYVTRKGAVRARTGDLGIIPGSMGAKSFIVRGKGNPESFCSCSHGAGRRMSRAEAKRQFSLADMAAQTVGIECRKDADVIDEIPGAYKDIDTVMENQNDLVEIVAQLRQVVCVKG